MSRFRAVKNGLYRPKGAPIHIRKLENTLRHLRKWNRLCEAIAYSMVTPVYERWSSGWEITFKALDLEDWQNIAVYNLEECSHTFNDVVVVDYSILRSKNREQFLSTYPELRELILSELKLICNTNT